MLVYINDYIHSSWRHEFNFICHEYTWICIQDVISKVPVWMFSFILEAYGCYSMLSLQKQFSCNLHSLVVSPSLLAWCWSSESVGWNLVMRMIMWSNFSLWILTWVLERERIVGVHRIGMTIIQSMLRHGYGSIFMVDSQLSVCNCSTSFCCTSS